jgi:HAE1 family hydrophobic/amphiphilic exporter-1
MNLADLPIRRPVAVLMLLISLLVLGAVSIPRLPLDFMPLVERPFVTVVVPFAGSHPLESLRQVVEPLEEELATIPQVESITANAEPGEARVTVEFGWSVNLDLKKMEVREAVDRARSRLPDEIHDIFIRSHQDGPSDGALVEGRISAERDLSESYDLLDRKIRRPLERIQGVASVRLDGVAPQQVRIDIDPQGLVRHGIEPQIVLAALQAANVDTDLGAVHGDLLRYEVRSVGRFTDLDEIRDLPLDRTGSLRIRDVAQVSLREPRLDYGRHLDREFAIGVQVYREPTANTVAVCDAVMERIHKITRDPELEGISLLVWMNQGEEIRNSLLALRNAGLFGGLLAVGILFVFLRRVSTTLIVAVAIPFSLVVACGVMFVTGMVLNVLTMLGLMVGVGMLVDNAVVVIENIHRLQQGGMPAREAARVGTRDVTLAVVAATATTLIVWSWLFTIEPGEMYIYIGAVAFTLCIAVVCSLLISLTFIPLAAARFVPHKKVTPGWLMRRLVPSYRGLLTWTLHHRFLGLLGLVVLAGSAAIPITLIEKSGQPKQYEREVSIFYNAHDPTTWDAMEVHVNQVEEWLESRKDELGYESLYSFYHDRGFGMTRVYPPASSLSEASLQELREQLREDLPVIAGVRLEIGDRNRMRHGRGSRNIVPVAIHGEDPEYLRGVALNVEKLLREVDGVRDVFGPSVTGSQEARVVVDPQRAAALGLTPRQVADVVSFTYRGRALQRFRGAHGEVEMLLGLNEELQPGLASLASLPIPAGDDRIVPLGSVARVTIGRTEREIEREDRKTSQWVNVEFIDEVKKEEGKERITTAMQNFALPEGYSWDWSRWGRDQDDTLGIMMQGIILSLLLVVILMAAIFESFLQPLAIVITLPLAFFGAFWALWLLGYKLEVVGFIGLIILIGMVVNNGIVMVDHVNNLRRAGKARVPALIEGCGDRLRPILMTTLSTIFGLLPLALSSFTVAGIYVDSMAVVIMGGLASSTIFTLLGLPLWYSTVEDIGSVVRRGMPRLNRAANAPAVTLPGDA